MKVFHSNARFEYSSWIENAKPVMTIEEADLVIFTGGEDVHPKFYNESVNKKTFHNIGRDIVEIELFKEAIKLNKPILGICRGSQLSCVMAGGKLIQHQNNPNFLHNMITYDNKTIIVTSTHHQAQYPFNLSKEDYKILGWSENLIKFRENGEGKQMIVEKDCEIVLYPKINTLAIQPHPEMFTENEQESINWFKQLLNDFLNKKL